MNQSNIFLPPHPGSQLRAKLVHLGCTRAVAARLLGLSRQTVYEITGEKQAITPSVALRIAKLTGTTAELWVDLQLAHDLAIARSNCRELLTKVPQLEEHW